MRAARIFHASCLAIIAVAALLYIGDYGYRWRQDRVTAERAQIGRGEAAIRKYTQN